MKAVAGLAWPQIQKTNMRSVLDAQPIPYSGPDNRKEYFDPLMKDIDAEPGDSQKAYRETVELLGSIYTGILKIEPAAVTRRRVLALPAMTSQKFTELMGAKEPRALIILAQYFAMMKMVEDIWWLKGMAEFELKGIASLLPSEWKWGLECCLKPQEIIKQR
jgi:hypothetical protein